jgi:hypothetical protein
MSMFMTFMIHCALNDTRANGSFFQNMVADPVYYYTLAVRCWCSYSFSKYSWTIYYLYLSILCAEHKPCDAYITDDNGGIWYSLVMMILLIYLPYLLFRTVRQLQKIILPLSLLIITTWLVARYCYNIYMSYEVDIFTVYFLVWQFVGLIYGWLHQDLPFLSFTFHQKSTCLSMAFLAFIVYDVSLRPSPTYVGFAFVWIMSVQDM